MAAPLLLGSLYSHHGGGADWIGPVVGGLTGLGAIGTYWTSRFDIESDHVVHKTGWIFRNDRRIPLNQVQNVNIRQNVMERLFKVATVDVETAMGKGRDLKLSVLSLSDAERFREELLGAAHLSTSGPAKVAESLVSLNRHDLLLGALTENHFGQIILGCITVGGPALGWLVPYAAKLSSSAAIAMFALAPVAFIVGGWLWGAASYYLKYGGFVVYRSGQLFRISYGLLNKVQLAIRPGRIEIVNVTITIPQRLMHRASLHAGTASSFGKRV